MPHVKSNLVQGSIVIDMENNAAAIPGSGDVPVVFTYSYDMARFVIASLDLPKWPKEYWVVGDRITWNEFLALAEDIKGQWLSCPLEKTLGGPDAADYKSF